MRSAIETLAGWLGVSPGVAAALGLAGVVLLVGVAVTWAASWRWSRQRWRGRMRSLGSWAILWALLVGAMAGGRWGVATLGAGVSLAGWYELWRMAGRRRVLRAEPAAALGLIVAQYALLGAGWGAKVILITPVAGWLVIAAAGVWVARTARFMERTSAAYGRLVVAGALPGFGVALVVDAPSSGPGGWAGWLVMAVLLTEFNDIAQAWWGRAIGRRPLLRAVSPNKTVEGAVGGVVTTMGAAVVLAPWLTPWAGGGPGPGGGVWWGVAAGVGAVTAVAGLVGDLVESAIKRGYGVKDSGTLLPGQGGVLDRIDSFLVTGPVFYACVLGIEAVRLGGGAG